MRPFPVLPPTYYHSHFMEMLTFVREVYGALLGDAETAFLSAFEALSPEAQCVYIRMSNRKRAIFTRADLDYSEIHHIDLSLQELHEQGFVRGLSPDDYRTCLDGLTRPALTDLARAYEIEVKSTWPKARLCDHLHGQLSFEDFLAALADTPRFLPAHRETVGFLLYLYFGKLSGNLLGFTLRDLGVVQVRQKDSYQARFISREEALGGYAYTRQLRALKGATPKAYLAAADVVTDLPPATTEFTQGLRDKLLHDLGRFFERQKDNERAVEFYAQSGLFESQERVVRMLYAQDDHDRARTLLEAMLDAPVHDEAFIFADDFYRRKFNGKRTSVFTDLLRDGPLIEADDLYRGLPELAAARHYEAQGFDVHHVENGLWPALFGLLFWDELFESEGALSSGFDRLPVALRDRTFQHKFAEAITQKLALIERGDATEIILDKWNRHGAEENGVFYGWPGLGDLIAAFLSVAPPLSVRQVLEAMTQDFHGLRDGFPDLLLMGPDGVHFVEVKGDGDQVRRHQLARLNLLKTAGFAVDIARVTFVPDPDQIYVVVDIETTGGRSQSERVTEIGAVKIQRGEIIDTWQTLINPERRIPAFITELTGITNAMVRDAPVFADIADDFAAFMKGGVFVAHNVNFDYGFLSQEFRGLERPFRYPKLCTVASMRKHFPGLAAYGLKPLSREFNIDLRNHHRAMSDALAAAELLRMVNAKRAGN
ncbi:exonuclease domain-containing protein [Asticcacaulis sp. BYS171W]|uniref:Exonuclease domain-containing protein n=1 Tax=Asticcacaulis aquaticus TaxID=2984212 RepID=A0ABT5HYL8_9CAUL|nr:exonuclease domain-containing protein [Asticcacaulis aquaticus]MDC7685169.1 exonuclease domain-containing protein [Asticcacaulis aquaticus]